jgi:long-chain fatty acid transport protein
VQNRLVIFALALLLLTPTAGATGLYELTGSHGSTLAFSARTMVSDTSLVYFNPALMTRLKPGFGLSFFGLWQSLSIGYDPRPAGVDISSSIYQARLQLADGTTERLLYRPLATEDIRKTRGAADPDALSGYVSIGTVQHLIAGKLAIGLHATIPVSEFQAQGSFFPDQREQFFSNSLHFELLGDRTRVNIISLALAGQPLSWLDIGAGITMTTRGTVRSEIYVADVTYQETAEINAELGIDVAFVPHFSLAVEPVTNLLLSASLHLPYQSDVDGQSELQMWNYPYDEGQDSLSQVFSFTYGYEPMRAVLGGSWTDSLSGNVGYSLSAWARYARWSEYRNRHGERPRDGWHDTLSTNVGGTVEWRGQTMGLEIGFVPTPVPQQSGMDNYIDSHRLTGGAGWQMPLILGAQDFHIGLSAQVHYLLPRSHAKDSNATHPVFDEFDDNSVDIDTGNAIPMAKGLQTNNPGYPGFDHSGWLVGASLFVKTAF